MPDFRDAACCVCGAVPAAWASKVCPICARTVCVKCGHTAYGRTFCSARCAEFFFHGDGDEDDDRES